MAMTIIGVTGGIGSGKTTVCRIFSELGAGVIDADQIAKDLYATEPTLLAQVVETFGRGVLNDDGSLNRGALAGAAFMDRDSAHKLNQLVHPYVRDAIRDEILRMGFEYPCVAVDAALLFEGKLVYTLDYVITVMAPKKVRLARVLEQGRLNKKEIIRRMALQLSDREKSLLSDYAIKNTGTLEELREAVENIYREVVG